MLSRPTTDQILLDCRAELLGTIDAAITDPAAKVAVQMMENVLRNCAARAAHEIAWMIAENEAMTAYAERVAASGVSTLAVTDALAAFAGGSSAGLHLDDVSQTYNLASQCLSVALEAAIAGGDPALEAAGRAIIDKRLATELEIMGEWTFVGRG